MMFPTPPLPTTGNTRRVGAIVDYMGEILGDRHRDAAAPPRFELDHSAVDGYLRRRCCSTPRRIGTDGKRAQRREHGNCCNDFP